jgi:hypothetical protein
MSLFVAYGIGLVIERNAPAASLAMYFGFLWVAWVIPVRNQRAKPQQVP